MKEIISLAIAFASGVVVPIIVHYRNVRRKIKLEKTTDSLREEIEFSTVISNKLEQLKEEYKADRIWIAQFHNGGYFYPTGKSIQKFSMIYEVVNPNISSTQHQFQNIPVNLFAKSINHLFDEDFIYIEDVTDMGILDYGLRAIAEYNETQSEYLYAIRNIDGRFIGMMGIEFIENIMKLDDVQLNDLSIEAATIGGVLMAHLSKR